MSDSVTLLTKTHYGFSIKNLWRCDPIDDISGVVRSGRKYIDHYTIFIDRPRRILGDVRLYLKRKKFVQRLWETIREHYVNAIFCFSRRVCIYLRTCIRSISKWRFIFSDLHTSRSLIFISLLSKSAEWLGRQVGNRPPGQIEKFGRLDKSGPIYTDGHCKDFWKMF